MCNIAITDKQTCMTHFNTSFIGWGNIMFLEFNIYLHFLQFKPITICGGFVFKTRAAQIPKFSPIPIPMLTIPQIADTFAESDTFGYNFFHL